MAKNLRKKRNKRRIKQFPNATPIVSAPQPKQTIRAWVLSRIKKWGKLISSVIAVIGAIVTVASFLGLFKTPHERYKDNGNVQGLLVPTYLNPEDTLIVDAGNLIGNYTISKLRQGVEFKPSLLVTTAGENFLNFSLKITQ